MIKPSFLSSTRCWKGLIAPYSLMARPAQGRLIPWKGNAGELRQAYLLFVGVLHTLYVFCLGLLTCLVSSVEILAEWTGGTVAFRCWGHT